MNDLIYLATPYSDPDPLVRERRFKIANRVAASLMREGQHVFSPISHTHPIAIEGGLPLGWEYWEAFDRTMLRVCTSIIILTQTGWENSTGIKAEHRIAIEFGIPRYFRTVESFGYNEFDV